MMNIFDESFVVAICFIIFVYFAYRPIKKSIINGLDSRVNEIKNKLENAEQVKKEAKILLEEIELDIQNFEHKKKDVVKNAERATKDLVEKKIQEMDLALERMKNSALKTIDNHQEKAAKAMQKEFSDHVLELVKNYLKDTKNNNAPDEEIFKHLLQKK